MAQLKAACRDKFSGHDELRPRNPLQFPQHSLDGSLCRHAQLARTRSPEKSANHAAAKKSKSVTKTDFNPTNFCRTCVDGPRVASAVFWSADQPQDTSPGASTV